MSMGTYTSLMPRLVLALCAGLFVTSCSGPGAGSAEAGGEQSASVNVSPSPSTPGDPVNSGSSASGPVAFPVALSDDGRYLVDSTGAPFLLQGDAAWSLLVQLSLDEAEDYLDARRSQRFNALIVNLIEHEYADDPPRNAEGEEPFLTPGDFSTPNSAYFDHVDRVLELARERGFVVLLAPAYLGFQGGEEGWFAEMTDNGADTLREYGRYVGARYERFDNIIWLEGGDYAPGNEGMQLVNAVVDGIKERDPDSMHAASWSPETSGLDMPVEWIDLNTIYTYEPAYWASIDQYTRHDGAAQILLETAYEAERSTTTPQSIRAQAYYALLTGCVGQVYGHGDIWPFTEDWRAALRAPGIVGMVELYGLFSALPWPELVPDLERQILLEESREDPAVAAVTPDHSLAVVYVPDDRSVQVDLSGFDSPINVHFYDPTDGSSRDVDLSTVELSSPVTLPTPGENSLGDSDWVVVVERSGD